MAAAEIAKSKIDAFAELGMAQTVKAVCEEIRRLYQWDQVPWVKQTSRMNARSRLSRSRCSKRRRGNSWQSSVGSRQLAVVRKAGGWASAELSFRLNMMASLDEHATESVSGFQIGLPGEYCGSVDQFRSFQVVANRMSEYWEVRRV